MKRLSVRGRAWNVVDGTHAAFWDRVEGGWESGTLNQIDRFVTAETIVVDVGAWIGPVTLYAAQRAAKVFSLEPDPIALPELRANIAANPDVAGKITLIPKALHPTRGIVRLGSWGAGGDSMSSVVAGDWRAAWSVETITPAELVTGLPMTGGVFVKIDVEGAEYGLAAAADVLWKRADVVFLSTHARLLNVAEAEKRAQTARLFKSLRGFRAYRVRNRGGLVRTPLMLMSAIGRPSLQREWLFRR